MVFYLVFSLGSSIYFLIMQYLCSDQKCIDRVGKYERAKIILFLHSEQIIEIKHIIQMTNYLPISEGTRIVTSFSIIEKKFYKAFLKIFINVEFIKAFKAVTL